MKIYVASPWPRRERAEMAAEILEAGGHEITRKWWLYEVEDNGGGVGVISEYRAAQAKADIDAVVAADAVVALVPESSGVGMWIETGAALALQKPVYLVNI